jgi:hypothetical protein
MCTEQLLLLCRIRSLRNKLQAQRISTASLRIEDHHEPVLSVINYFLLTTAENTDVSNSESNLVFTLRLPRPFVPFLHTLNNP